MDPPADGGIPPPPDGGSVYYLAVARLHDRVCVADFVVPPAGDGAPTAGGDVYAAKLRKVLDSGRVGEHARLTITDATVGSIHYDADPSLLYMAITTPAYPQRAAFKLLTAAREAFEGAHGDGVGGAKERGLSRPARGVFRGVLDRYGSVAQVDRVAAVGVQVAEVQAVMASNIQSVLRNAENLDTLLDRSDAMRGEAGAFQRSSVAVKKSMWWKNTRLTVVVVILLIVLAAVIVVPLATKARGKR